jgi:hypothetical protein
MVSPTVSEEFGFREGFAVGQYVFLDFEKGQHLKSGPI